MKHKLTWSLLPVALAVCAAFPAPALADTNQDLLNELRALKARVSELEKKIEAQAGKQAEAPAPGMTPEQQQDFNRIAVKAEALEDSRDMLGFKGFKVSGYMDPTFVFNQRQHRAGFQFLNSVGDGGYTYDNSYIGSAAIDFVKETEGGSRWRLTLSPQRSTQAVSEGSASILHEASVSVPLTDLQTRFIAGHIPDWSGYEYLQPTLNKLITHNLLFDLTLPTAYTGAGLELTRDKWIVKGVVANMNASKRSANEKTPVLAYRVDYAKGEFQGFGFAGVHGKAHNGKAFDDNGDAAINPITSEAYSTRDTRVDLFEFDAYFIRGDWTVQGQASWGRQQKASITANPDTGELRNAIWTGLSGLVAYKFDPRLEGIVRFDRIFNSKNGGGLLTYASADDHNGIGPAQVYLDDGVTLENANKGIDRAALTLGMNYAFNLSTVFKLEYRYDWASGPVFLDTKSGDYKKNNQLLSTAVVVSF
ncbi:MAG TPA: DUF3138 family protein [Aquabacterium sp.]|uniref:DUF3138 family protein n=1 Tax=Aquabacterium sp. TaxID=1872578 RepID=UPI002E31BE5F|nr:DUF3138 family protein [Aquabacterium sp.]HEX5355132.1 DUF3138 family protein [Aquabacterium sp.]